MNPNLYRPLLNEANGIIFSSEKMIIKSKIPYRFLSKRINLLIEISINGCLLLLMGVVFYGYFFVGFENPPSRELLWGLWFGIICLLLVLFLTGVSLFLENYLRRKNRISEFICLPNRYSGFSKSSDHFGGHSYFFSQGVSLGYIGVAVWGLTKFLSVVV